MNIQFNHVVIFDAKNKTSDVIEINWRLKFSFSILFFFSVFTANLQE